MAILSKRTPLQVILASVIQSSTTTGAFAPITSCSQIFATNVILGELQSSHSHSSQSQITNRHKSTVTMMQQQSNTQESTTTNNLLFSPSSKYHPTQNGLHRRRRWLVVDFDGTCTEHDTTPLLPRLAAFASTRRKVSSIISSSATNGSSDNGDDENAGTITIDHKQELQKRLTQFQVLEDEFMKRYSEAKSTILSSEELSIHQVLDALDEPSNIVTDMVSESRVLEGLGHVSAGELEEMVQLYGVSSTTTPPANNGEESSVGEHKEIEVTAGNVDSSLSGKSNKYDIHDEDEAMLVCKVVVRLRHGCESTLARILLENKGSSNCTPGGETQSKSTCLGWNLAVLSINWCPALIDASLVRPVLNKRRSILQIDSCNTEVPIWSNSVDGEGTVTLHVPGALAKRDRIKELRRHIINAHDVSDDEEGSDTSSHVIVYVGDSSTDLAALLEADIGIIMGNSSSMIAMAQKYGVSVVPLGHRKQHDLDVLGGEKILWTVESWQEIDEMLIEVDEHWR